MQSIFPGKVYPGVLVSISGRLPSCHKVGKTIFNHILVLGLLQSTHGSPVKSKRGHVTEHGHVGEMNRHSEWKLHPSKDVIMKHVRKDVDSKKLKRAKDLLEEIEDELEDVKRAYDKVNGVKRAYDEQKQKGSPLDAIFAQSGNIQHHAHNGESKY